MNVKKSDTNTNKIKSTTWKRVTDEFNSISGETYRHSQILRNKYENIKKRSKKKYADEKTFLKKTGGGPPKNFYFDDTDKDMKEIIGIQITGLQSEFDDYHVPYGDLVEVMDNEEMHEMDLPELREQPNDGIEIEEFSNDIQVAPISSQYSHDISEPFMSEHSEHNYTSSKDVTAETKTFEDWSKYTPDMLRKKISTPLKSTPKKLPCSQKENNFLKKTRNLNSKLVEWSSSKIEFAEIQKTSFLKEHQLKLKHMQEKYDQMMELQEAESAMRIKFCREEHDIVL